ncbi:MAG: penicillin-binding protein 2 [Patescibacteria group bacterium]
MIWRYRAVLIILILAFLAVLSRLFYWQVVKAEDLSRLGQSQYERSINILPQRGEIKTSDNFQIVTNRISYLVFANPKQIKNKNETSIILSSELGIDKASVSSQLSMDKYWISLKTGIDTQEKKKIEDLRIQGVDFEETFTRFYPEASMAAHLLGFVGKDDLGKDKGYFGLEGYYDRLLRGKEGAVIEVFDALGRPVLAQASSNPENLKGNSLVLNIDRAVQFITDEKLKKGIKKYGAAGGIVAVMEPKTGNIIALSSFPSFSPSEYGKFDSSLYKNPSISNLYEPGSTLKPLIMSAALDAGIVKPQTKCSICDKPVSVGGYEIRTWNDEYFKDINMVDVIRRSDNTGMVFVGQKLGADRMTDYLTKFGIGTGTGIDLQGEVYQALPPKDKWYEADLATRAFGQGISVTPIELLDSFSSIANGGIRMEPHVVREIQTPEGKTIKIAPKALGRTISENTSKVMTEMLVNAVNKGEASYARVKGYRIAGKTGTASIPIAGHYDPNKTVASFIGYAPADNPKFAMLVIFNKPTTSIYGAETAAPVFFDIARQLLLYYGISPTE